jgi:hypothetical protein
VVRWAPALQRTAKGALRRVRGTSARSKRPSSIIKQQTHLRLLAADSARALRSASRPPRKEGAGKAGCRLAPARLPCKNDAHATHRSDTGQPKHPAFPAQWFDGLCALSPGDEFCLASVASAKFADVAPVETTPPPQRLDRSNDGQDHTVSPYASAPSVVCGRQRAHGVHPALRAPFRIGSARVHRSPIRGS